MDEQTRRMLRVAGGLVCLLSVSVATGWLLHGIHDGPVPVVEALDGPIRIRPSNPGGLQVAGLGEDVLDAGSNDRDNATGVMAPLPEEPSPAALRAQAQSGALGVADVKVDAEADAISQSDPSEPATLPGHSSAPIAAERHVVQVLAPSLTGKVSGTAQRPVQVQLAAMASESAAVARWKLIQSRLPELRGRKPIITRANPRKPTLWRLRLDGLDNRMQAQEFCQHVQANGFPCVVAEF